MHRAAARPITSPLLVLVIRKRAQFLSHQTKNVTFKKPVFCVREICSEATFQPYAARVLVAYISTQKDLCFGVITGQVGCGM